jgi:hypothetical protein
MSIHWHKFSFHQFQYGVRLFGKEVPEREFDYDADHQTRREQPRDQ